MTRNQGVPRVHKSPRKEDEDSDYTPAADRPSKPRRSPRKRSSPYDQPKPKSYLDPIYHVSMDEIIKKTFKDPKDFTFPPLYVGEKIYFPVKVYDTECRLRFRENREALVKKISGMKDSDPAPLRNKKKVPQARVSDVENYRGT